LIPFKIEEVQVSWVWGELETFRFQVSSLKTLTKQQEMKLET